MPSCSFRHIVEIRARRLWCADPRLHVEAVAQRFAMTAAELRETLFYIDDLSAKTIIDHGKERLRKTGSTTRG